MPLEYKIVRGTGKKINPKDYTGMWSVAKKRISETPKYYRKWIQEIMKEVSKTDSKP